MAVTTAKSQTGSQANNIAIKEMDRQTVIIVNR